MEAEPDQQCLGKAPQGMAVPAPWVPGASQTAAKSLPNPGQEQGKAAPG